MKKLFRQIKERLKVFKQGQKSTRGRQGIKISTFPSGILSYFVTIRKAGNKIQDDYKPDLFEVTGKHSDPNAFFVKPLDGRGPVKQVNRPTNVQLGRNGARRGEKVNLIRSKKIQKSLRLQFTTQGSKLLQKPQGHQYHLRSKGPAPIPAPRVSRVRESGGEA